jgi:tryptophan synthase alpha chain
MIAAEASGFLYLVSKTGVTGSAGLDVDNIAADVLRVRAASSLPVCVGFGIRSAEDVAAVAAAADGVVIGSAFERRIEEHLTDPRLPRRLAESVRDYKEATRPKRKVGGQ